MPELAKDNPIAVHSKNLFATLPFIPVAHLNLIKCKEVSWWIWSYENSTLYSNSCFSSTHGMTFTVHINTQVYS